VASRVLFSALVYDDRTVLERLKTLGLVDLTCKNKFGENALMVAAKYGLYESLQFFLDLVKETGASEIFSDTSGDGYTLASFLCLQPGHSISRLRKDYLLDDFKDDTLLSAMAGFSLSKEQERLAR
jgi:hypothetical protein